ncbi:MAG: 16S rRNA (cytidine(1402)-2'-O)-methyltransferase [Eubacterium sp.]|nr:16S rRNA (cytidine(1402)-2'-O)-methyltransferase [Eubacterium sp.]
MAGRLVLCATPIGNLGDITPRVLEALQSADRIAAEDTRNSRKLLNHFDIHTPMVSYHENNRFDRGRELVGRMLQGETIALITDAGTPAISDPGEELVAMAAEAGIEVTSLPGAAACITALTLSGLPARRFAMEGFLPRDKKEREAILEELQRETRTIILYEAPHRLKKTLQELASVLGEERRVSLCRELTKIHETVLRETLGEALRRYGADAEEPRGEYVLVIEGRSREAVQAEKQAAWQEMTIAEHVRFYMAQGLDQKEAMKQTARDRGCGKRDIYAAVMKNGDTDG